MKKKSLFLILTTLFFIAVFGLLPLKGVRAGASDNVSGWAWSENIGWISFNCTNVPKVCNGGATTTGSVCSGAADCPGAACVDTCSLSNYGVKVSTSTGLFSGYAWSENIGWISFAPAGAYPASPDYQACLDLPGSGQTCDGVGDYKISGWARACSVFQSGCSGALAASTALGGWDGWIKLSGATYGISLNSVAGEVEKWSWGGDDNNNEAVIGWVSFNCKNFSCLVVDYQVKAVSNQPPSAPSILSTNQNSCAWGTSPQSADGFSVTFNWSAYSDPDGDSQAAYEVWVDDDPSFTGAMFNNLVLGSGTSYTLDLAHDDNSDWLTKLIWSTTYYWKVRVQDNRGATSSFSASQSLTTPAHAAPYVDFGPSPQSPSASSVVTFIQNSTTTPENRSLCYDAAGTNYYCDTRNTAYNWDFGNGKTSTYKGNATTTYGAVSAYTAVLGITDNTLAPAITCSKSTNINVQFALPWWREVSPF